MCACPLQGCLWDAHVTHCCCCFLRCCSCLPRLFITSPNTYPALLQAVANAESSQQQQQQQPHQPPAQPVGGPEQQAAAVQQRFLDRWISVATVTLLEGEAAL